MKIGISLVNLGDLRDFMALIVLLSDAFFSLSDLVLDELLFFQLSGSELTSNHCEDSLVGVVFQLLLLLFELFKIAFLLSGEFLIR